MIAASSGLRWGEITALTGQDVRVERDAGGAVRAVRVTVDKGVVRARGQMIVREPKTPTSNRTIAVYGADRRDPEGDDGSPRAQHDDGSDAIPARRYP